MSTVGFAGLCGVFLDGFCARDDGAFAADEERLLGGGGGGGGGGGDAVRRPPLSDDEVEAECVDLCFHYLVGANCPPLLATYITREVTSDVLDSVGKLDNKSSTVRPINDKEGKGKANECSNEGDASFVGIESNWLVQKVVSVAKKICAEWKSQIPSHVLQHRPNKPDVSEHAIKNTRRKMEDKHVIMPYFSELMGLKSPNHFQFYAVYDGHAGLEAAKYSAVHLHCHLADCLRNGLKINEAFKEAFAKTDRLFVNFAKQENVASGSTAICAVIEDDFFHIAWLGDSQAVLVRDRKPVVIMDPHKPEREDEKNRIQALGGYVVWFGAWRVNGNLAVSRAIGDASFKPFICADPDITSIARDPSDEYLVLACDGLWDTLKHEDLVVEVENHLQKGNDRSGVARWLIEVAKDRGSSDNITVIVIFLQDGAVFKSGGGDGGCKAEGEAVGKLNSPRGSKDSKSQQGHSAAEQRTDASMDSCSSGNNPTDSSHLALETKCLGCMAVFEDITENAVENDSSELESSGDVHVLSADSAKNILDPLRIHSSDDTNGLNISGETDYEAAGYESSPPSGLPREASRDSEDSLSPDLHHPEGNSDASTSNAAPHGASVDISDTSLRPRRRRRSANHCSRKENLRPCRHDKTKTTTPPCLHSISADRKQLDASFRDSCHSLNQTSSHLLKMLSGFGARGPTQKPNSSFRSTNKDRWTIAVEVEDWATMFESNKPISTTQGMNLSTHW